MCSPFCRGESKCFGTAQRAVPHAEKEGYEGAPDLGAAEAVDVEVEREVHQLQIVGNRAEHLQREMWRKIIYSILQKDRK